MIDLAHSSSSRRRARGALAALLVALSPLPSPAARAAGGLTLGVYCPSLPFGGPSERVAFAKRLAEHLGKALGIEVKGLAFAHGADLGRRVRRGGVDLVLANPAYLAERPRDFEPVAAATHGGAVRAPWSLVAASPTTLEQLAGKRVALPRMGRQDQVLVQRFMFDDELSAGYFKFVTVPDTASALAALRIGRADAALVPRYAARGLSAVVATRPLPLPLLALPKRRSPAAPSASEALRAIATFVAPAVGVEGWAKVGRGVAHELLEGPQRVPLLSQSRIEPISVGKLLEISAPPWRLSDAAELLPPLAVKP